LIFVDSKINDGAGRCTVAIVSGGARRCAIFLGRPLAGLSGLALSNAVYGVLTCVWMCRSPLLNRYFRTSSPGLPGIAKILRVNAQTSLPGSVPWSSGSTA